MRPIIPPFRPIKPLIKTDQITDQTYQTERQKQEEESTEENGDIEEEGSEDCDEKEEVVLVEKCSDIGVKESDIEEEEGFQN